jgi:UDP-N-acetylmuramoyl-tripeptide--D-alanyl-D-alanine ligase
MIPLDAEAVADIVGGELVGTAGVVTGVSIDTRTIRPGDLFVPLPGEHVDGHAYAAAAMAAGAAAWLCAEDRAEELLSADDAPAGAIVVDDPLDALTGLGAWLRDEVDPIVIAITGSNGKTTTKDMAAAAIGAARVTVANPGSFNNEIGLPLTLCLLTADAEVLICEVGARGIGHIAGLMPLLRPDIAIVTTIAGAHIGEFGSLDAIAQAKGELVEALDVDGIAILNADVPRVAGLAARTAGRVVTVGLAAEADLHPDEVTLDATATATVRIGDVVVTLPRPGAHQVGNALAALAAAQAADVPLDVAAAGLAAAAVSRWRMEVTETALGVRLVNDAYNANPHSVLAALDTLGEMQTGGRRWAVLGHMAELGDEADAGHRQVGRRTAELALDGLVVVGEVAEGIARGAAEAGFAGSVLRAADVQAAVDLLDEHLDADDVVLIKASRSAALESVVTRLTAAHAERTAT